MVWFKCCPRCSGDLCEEADLYGNYIACLQCGYYLSDVEEVVLRYSPPDRVDKPNQKAPVPVAMAR